MSNVNPGHIDDAYLPFNKNFKPIDEITNQKAKQAFKDAEDYIARGMAGGRHPWQEILKETYQGKGEEGDFLFDLVTSLDYLIGIYEVNVWGAGRLSCPHCGRNVPTFYRTTGDDEGEMCNRCWYKK